MKEISKFFLVTIDELLSSEKIVNIAERENKSNIRNICDLLFGITDLMSILLIILPLYPKTVNDFVYSIRLFSHSDLTPVNRTAYWTVFILLILFGAVKVILNQVKIENCYCFDFSDDKTGICNSNRISSAGNKKHYVNKEQAMNS